MDINVDKVILSEVKRFFRETDQTNWGKNQIRNKIDEISENVIETYFKMRKDLQK